MLREPQVRFKADFYQAWNEGARNVMGVGPTGFGKTVVMGSIAQDFDCPTVAIAHRQELIAQIAMAFNREMVPHAVIAPEGVRKEIIKAEMKLHGRSFYNPTAAVRVAGVDSLRDYDPNDRWLQQVKLGLMDEGHHTLRANKFGAAVAKFPNALWAFFTAHALRADGQGLGRGADGVVDRLVVGPSARAIINQGYLTDYKVFCPPSDVDTSDLKPGGSGELNMTTVRERIENSRTIVGDVVDHYRRVAEGELGITFAVSLKSAHQICDKFNAARIPAAIIEAKTPIAERAHIMRMYRERKLIQLINVDCLGEGTDVPACVIVSMARPSASFQLVAQQFGRMLRILVSDDLNAQWHSFTDAERLGHIARSSKPYGILNDHVGNIAIAGGTGRHGLPDRPRTYSLERRERRSKAPDNAIPLTVCLNYGPPACFQSYERVLSACPHCGFPKPPPRDRSAPEQVDGDLVELDPEVLRVLRGEIDRIDLAPRIPNNVTEITALAIKNNHWKRQQAQATLRDAITTWAGWLTNHQGKPEREALRRFFFQFGIDMATAQTLGAREAADLELRVRAQLLTHNITKVS